MGNKEIKSMSPMIKEMQMNDTTRGVSDWQRLKRMVMPRQARTRGRNKHS